MTRPTHYLRKCRGNNDLYDVIENTDNGGFRIGTVYPSSSNHGSWSASCCYAVAKAHNYQGNLCGTFPATLFETKEQAGETVLAEKNRRKG